MIWTILSFLSGGENLLRQGCFSVKDGRNRSADLEDEAMTLNQCLQRCSRRNKPVASISYEQENTTSGIMVSFYILIIIITISLIWVGTGENLLPMAQVGNWRAPCVAWSLLWGHNTMATEHSHCFNAIFCIKIFLAWSLLFHGIHAFQWSEYYWKSWEESDTNRPQQDGHVKFPNFEQNKNTNN